MSLTCPATTLETGFKTGPGGIHDSRTMMLADLRTLLDTCPPDASPEQYRAAVVDDNVLHKGSFAGRTGTFRRLLRLYAFDREVLLFRALRDLWDDDPSAQPLLALLCTVARDPTFRGSAEFILATEPGETVTSAAISQAIGEAFPDRYNENILGKIGRNAGSSWTQSGHLQGRSQLGNQQDRLRKNLGINATNDSEEEIRRRSADAFRHTQDREDEIETELTALITTRAATERELAEVIAHLT